VRDLGAPFTRFWTATTVSALGDGITFVALPLLAARLTREPSEVALISVAEYAGPLLLGLLTGALVDRWDRRRIMAVTDVIRLVMFGAFVAVVASGSATLPLLVAVAFLSGLLAIFNQNAASAYLPQLLGDRDKLEKANTWLQMGITLPSSLIGPAAAGLLFAVAVSLPFTVDAVTFFVSALLILSLPRTPREVPEGGHEPLVSALRAGVRYLWHSQVLRTLCLLLAVTNAAAAAGMATLVLYAQDVLHVGERGYGLLLGVFAIGALLGMLFVGWARKQLGAAGVVRLMLLGTGTSMVIVGLADSVVVTALSFVLAGALATLWNIVTISLRQRIVPDELLGRVTSAYRVVGLGSMPLGAAVGGAVASGFGLSAPFIVAGVASLLAWLAALRWLPQRVVDDATAAAAATSATAV
jgi:MFS family permease